MKLAVFHDLPDGGALHALYQIVAGLSKMHHVDLYTFHRGEKSLLDFAPIVEALYATVVPNAIMLPERLRSDVQALWHARFASKKLATIIDRKSYDAVIITHTRFFQAPWILRYLKTRKVFLCQEPTRAFFEDFLAPDPSWPLANQIYERVIRSLKKRVEVKNASYADATIANSHFSARSIKRAYGTKSVPVLLGVNVDQFYPLNIKKKKQVIVVGNDEPQKALDFTIAVVGLVEKSLRPDLVVVSPRENDFLKLKALARDRNVNLRVYNRVSNDELCKLYNQSILTLATAIKEPFGLSVVESLACGTPVLAVDEGGFTETISNKKVGWLVKRDLKLFSHKLIQLIKNPEKLREMSETCVTHVKQNFSWDRVVKETEKALLKPSR